MFRQARPPPAGLPLAARLACRVPASGCRQQRAARRVPRAWQVQALGLTLPQGQAQAQKRAALQLAAVQAGQLQSAEFFFQPVLLLQGL